MFPFRANQINSKMFENEAVIGLVIFLVLLFVLLFLLLLCALKRTASAILNNGHDPLFNQNQQFQPNGPENLVLVYTSKVNLLDADDDYFMDGKAV